MAGQEQQQQPDDGGGGEGPKPAPPGNPQFETFHVPEYSSVGYLSVRDWYRDYGYRHRILLDGVDVTDDCFEANVEEGWVCLYLRRPDGQIATGTGPSGELRVMTAHRIGRIEIRAMPDGDEGRA